MRRARSRLAAFCSSSRLSSDTSGRISSGCSAGTLSLRPVLTSATAWRSSPRRRSPSLTCRTMARTSASPNTASEIANVVIASRSGPLTVERGADTTMVIRVCATVNCCILKCRASFPGPGPSAVSGRSSGGGRRNSGTSMLAPPSERDRRTFPGPMTSQYQPLAGRLNGGPSAAPTRAMTAS